MPRALVMAFQRVMPAYFTLTLYAHSSSLAWTEVAGIVRWTDIPSGSQVPSPSPVLRSAVSSVGHVDLVHEVLVEGRARVVCISMMIVMRKKRRVGHTARSGIKNGLPILKTIGQGLTKTRYYTRKG
jgi:hypothetical protein